MSNLQRRPCGLSVLGMCNSSVRLALLVGPLVAPAVAPSAPPPESATRQSTSAQLRDTRTTVAAMKRGARKSRAAHARTPKGTR